MIRKRRMHNDNARTTNNKEKKYIHPPTKANPIGWTKTKTFFIFVFAISIFTYLLGPKIITFLIFFYQTSPITQSLTKSCQLFVSANQENKKFRFRFDSSELVYRRQMKPTPYNKHQTSIKRPNKSERAASNSLPPTSKQTSNTQTSNEQRANE